MGATKSTDFTFAPKVWAGHVSAYWRKKLVFGSLAMMNNTLTGAPGDTINFPFFTNIGDAEEPAEDSGLFVDKLGDSSFSCTIKEVAKAVGVKKRALRKSAAEQDVIFAEVQSQIARVHAEKMDADLVTEINTSGNYVQGFNALANTDTAKVGNIAKGRIVAFGDKASETVALVMHSLCELDLLTDTTAGFLKADALDPMYAVPGFKGRLLGMALIISDQCPRATDVGGNKAYHAFAVKANPYGIITGNLPEMEHDYDMLHREHVFAACQYYGVKAFHAKVSADDLRIARMTFATSISA